MRKLFVLMFCLMLALPIVCNATTTVAYSKAGLTYVCSPGANCAGGTGSTVVTVANTAWASLPSPAKWISYTSNTSGQGSYTQTPNGTVMTVSDSFNLIAGQLVHVDALADDTTGILVTPGLTVFAALGMGNTYHKCSDLPIGCLTSTEGNFSFVAPTTGTYSVAFDVHQMNAYGFGLDYRISTPEPSSLGMLGSGLFLIGGMLRRKLLKS